MNISINNKINRNFSIKNAAFKQEEDFYAPTRNGHLLKDTFNKENSSLDIMATGLFPANVLSNLSKKPFIFDGIFCESIEGILQSLKTNNTEDQKKICSLYGGMAKKQSKKYKNWMINQKLYWNDKEYDRNSKEYSDLLKRIYDACYKQNPIFRIALDLTKGLILTHTKGINDKSLTVLTSDEFVKILTDMRDAEKI